MKRASFFIAVVLGLLLLADFGLRAAAEKAAADLIDKKIEQRVDPSVGLGGFPFLFSLLSGSFDEVTVAVPSAAQGSLVVDDIELTFSDVRLEALEVLGGRGDLRARTLRGRGVITETTINNVVGEKAPGVRVIIDENRVLVSRDGVEVDATAIVANDNVLISAGEATELTFEIPLPALLEDVRFSSLQARPGQLVLRIEASRVRIRA